jgi:hypothetical protein
MDPAMRKKMDEKAMKILTDSQKAKWKSLLGKPFTFPKMERNGPPPGGPGPGGPAQG